VRVKIGLIFYGEQWSSADIDKAIQLFQQTMQEDKDILVRVQQGLGSRYHQPGPLAPTDMEGTIWDFYQYLSRRLT
jgi:choline monooxygenase